MTAAVDALGRARAGRQSSRVEGAQRVAGVGRVRLLVVAWAWWHGRGVACRHATACHGLAWPWPGMPWRSEGWRGGEGGMARSAGLRRTPAETHRKGWHRRWVGRGPGGGEQGGRRAGQGRARRRRGGPLLGSCQPGRPSPVAGGRSSMGWPGPGSPWRNRPAAGPDGRAHGSLQRSRGGVPWAACRGRRAVGVVPWAQRACTWVVVVVFVAVGISRPVHDGHGSVGWQRR